MYWRILLPTALLASVVAHAQEVYLCDKDGKPYYSGKPLHEACHRLDLPVSEPSAEEVQRIQQEQQRKEALRQAEQAREMEERKIRAEEDAARAAERQARAAEAGARYQRDLLKAQEAENLNHSVDVPAVIVITPAIPQNRLPPAGFGIHPYPGKDSRNHPGPGDQPVPQPGVDPQPQPQPSTPALNLPARLP